METPRGAHDILGYVRIMTSVRVSLRCDSRSPSSPCCSPSLRLHVPRGRSPEHFIKSIDLGGRGTRTERDSLRLPVVPFNIGNNFHGK